MIYYHMHDDHDHCHCDHHDHSHNDSFTDNDQALALMSYMLDHNIHHAEELHDMAHKLEASGMNEASDYVHDALHYYAHGNEMLEKAVAAMKKA